MLTKLSIIAYKSIEKQIFELKPLTLLTAAQLPGSSMLAVLQAATAVLLPMPTMMLNLM